MNKTKVVNDDSPMQEIDFTQLTVVSGRPGIFLAVGNPNAQNKIGVRKWSDIYGGNAVTVSVDLKTLKPFNSIAIMANVELEVTEKKSKKKKLVKEPVLIGINTIFQNLHQYEETLAGDLGVEELDITDEKTSEHLKAIAAPNYEPEFFPTHKLRDLLKYYKWVKESLLDISENLTK